MNEPYTQFIEYLEEGAAKLELSLAADSIDKLKAHYGALRKWSERMNLTSIVDCRDAAEKLYLESILAASKIEENVNVYDIGSGAGFPGLVIKAVSPDREVILVEARAKKVSFLRHAARQMNLTRGLKVIHGRAGWDKLEIQAGELFSRATFPPKEWISLAPRLTGPGGRFWLFSCFSGPEEDGAETDIDLLLRYLPEDFSLERVHCYRLPFCGAERQLLAFRRKKAEGETINSK